jgi:ElaB/YqjD/DUF883 family membrane-anchored ribosome-binding protein
VAGDEALDEVRTELGRLVERIDELIYDVLSEAAAEGARERPDLERRLTRARNAVIRAHAILGGGAQED